MPFFRSCIALRRIILWSFRLPIGFRPRMRIHSFTNHVLPSFLMASHIILASLGLWSSLHLVWLGGLFLRLRGGMRTMVSNFPAILMPGPVIHMGLVLDEYPSALFSFHLSIVDLLQSWPGWCPSGHLPSPLVLLTPCRCPQSGPRSPCSTPGKCVLLCRKLVPRFRCRMRLHFLPLRALRGKKRRARAMRSLPQSLQRMGLQQVLRCRLRPPMSKSVWNTAAKT